MKELCKLLDAIYTICLIILVAAMFVVLLVQIVCLFLMNGPTSVWIYDFIMPKAGIVASIMVVSVVLLSYLRPSKKKTDD